MPWNLPSFSLAQPVEWNALLLFGSLLLLGLIGGHIVTKSRWVPRLTGYLLVGFALGADGLNWLSGDMLKLVDIFADVAVAVVIYQLGRYLDLDWLRREKWLLATAFTNVLLSFT